MINDLGIGVLASTVIAITTGEIAEVPNPCPSSRVTIEAIEFVDTTVLDAEDASAILENLPDTALDASNCSLMFEAIANQTTQLYLNRGYLTSKANIQAIEFADGIIYVPIIEGQLGEIRINEDDGQSGDGALFRTRNEYVRQRIRQAVREGEPVRIGAIEDQLRLLNTSPLFENVEASIRPTGELGESDLYVRVQEAPPFESTVSVDNFSPASVGSERLNTDLTYRNLIGYGDELVAAYRRTAQNGAEALNLAYRIPINAREGTLELRAAFDRNEVIQDPFDALNIEGESEQYGISFRQPLVRSPREEFALSLGFDFRDGQTFIFDRIPFPFGIGPDEDGVSRTSVIRLGQDYVRRDGRGAWGVRSQFSLGTGWLNATTNEAPIPDSRFISWLGQAQRVQSLNDDHLLIVQLDIQLTPDSLLPSEQFVIGGGQSVRGYRQNARSGDNGVRFSVEDRIAITRNAAGQPAFQIAPFIDIGTIWNHADNPNSSPDQTFLASGGLGLIYTVRSWLTFRVDYGIPFIRLDDAGDNLQDAGITFSLGLTRQF